MLTSFLSLYIAAAIDPGIHSKNPIFPEKNTQETSVKTAGYDFEKILKNNKIPIKNPYYVSPLIDAEAVIAIDYDSEEILFEKNIHKKNQFASITKLMTILIILEENKLSDIVTVSQNAASTEGSTMYLRAGEKIAIENLLYGALIESANDSAVALAEYNSGSVKKFVEKMNKKAQDLGLLNTHFQNPIGLDNSNNYSTAYDISKIAKYVYNFRLIQYSAKLKDLEVKSEDLKYTHKLKSTNELLGSYLNILGLKTGKTDAAGLCLVSIAENENENKNKIITVVLNSPARFRETKILTDWIFRAYKF